MALKFHRRKLKIKAGVSKNNSTDEIRCKSIGDNSSQTSVITGWVQCYGIAEPENLILMSLNTRVQIPPPSVMTQGGHKIVKGFVKSDGKQVYKEITMKYLLGLMMFILATTPLLAKEKELQLLIQPALSQETTEQYYGALTKYLAQATGMKLKIVVADNYLAHWNAVRKKSGYDLVLDAAHFTDYRIRNLNYEVLAKAPAAMSFSFITKQGRSFSVKDGLLLKTIATTPSPSLGGVQLLQMYPNPARQPRLIEVKNYAEAIARVKSGKVFSALVPTPMISGDRDINTVEVTQSVPQIALSASPDLSKTIKDRIRRALMEAGNTQEGQRMLARINLTDFESATSSTYAGYASLLKGVWGY